VYAYHNVKVTRIYQTTDNLIMKKVLLALTFALSAISFNSSAAFGLSDLK